MKKAIKLTLLVALTLCSTSIFAQKFGRINTQAILMAMPETKQMQEDLQKYAATLDEQMENMRVEYNNMMADLQKNMNTMTDSARALREKELNDLIARSNEYQQIAQEDFSKKQQELYAPIAEKLDAAIAKVGKEQGYMIVFDESVPSMAYFDETALTDLSAAVKAELGVQ